VLLASEQELRCALFHRYPPPFLQTPPLYNPPILPPTQLLPVVTASVELKDADACRLDPTHLLTASWHAGPSYEDVAAMPATPAFWCGAGGQPH